MSLRLRVLGSALCALGAAAPVTAQVRLHEGVTVKSLEEAVARDSADPNSLYALALGYWSKRRWDDVERTLDRALAIEPRNALALLALAHLPYARRPRLWEEEEQGTVPAEWQPALLKRDRLARLAFLVDPLVDLQIVGAVAPEQSSLLRGGQGASELRTALVGLTTFRNAQYDQAFGWFDRLARLLGESQDPGRVPGFVLWYRGLAAAHLNDLPAAIADFTRLDARTDANDAAAFGVDPTLVPYVLAWLNQQAGRLDLARTGYEAALTLDLGLWMAHVQLARIHDDRGEWNEAIRERRLALEANPDDPSLLLDLAITLFKAGRAEEAVEPLAGARRLTPMNFRVAYFEGVVAEQLQRPAEARQAFQRFLALAPSRFVAEIAEVQRHLRQLP